MKNRRFVELCYSDPLIQSVNFEQSLNSWVANRKEFHPSIIIFNAFEQSIVSGNGVTNMTPMSDEEFVSLINGDINSLLDVIKS